MIRVVHITDEDVETLGGPMSPTNGRRFEHLKSSEPIRFLEVTNFNLAYSTQIVSSVAEILSSILLIQLSKIILEGNPKQWEVGGK